MGGKEGGKRERSEDGGGWRRRGSPLERFEGAREGMGMEEGGGGHGFSVWLVMLQCLFSFL